MFSGAEINSNADNLNINQILKDLYNSNFFENVSSKNWRRYSENWCYRISYNWKFKIEGVKAEKMI